MASAPGCVIDPVTFWDLRLFFQEAARSIDDEERTAMPGMVHIFTEPDCPWQCKSIASGEQQTADQVCETSGLQEMP
jgi:hypothetical protein